ncbi:S8 family peptidase [Sphingomonas sp. MMSM20]|uniref:S8 family peptidase n=1 Tax=Sphingomonas lycopersici TaxID=2951807 RepID=UPI002238EADF|nr:S8 family peptidase [Sphingomonas lycopersici]MCW6530755.1 S8 family peptidase [Sphingomonas lycopersici]
MPHDPDKPLLRLNDPKATPRRPGGGGGGRSRKFDRAEQKNAHGPIFQQLRDVLNSPNAAMELRADPNALAPERLLVFEVTGSIANFANAVARIPGLEFAGEEELEADEFDTNPEFYMLVPQLGALRQILSLWDGWEKTGTVPHGFTPWRDLFEHLRAIRVWGPADRVSERNREYFLARIDGAPDDFQVRIEIELVFRHRPEARAAAEHDLVAAIAAAGGGVIDRAQRATFAYHSVLADIPAAEIRRICSLDPGSLAGADPIASILPQSVGVPLEAGDSAPLGEVMPLPPLGDPIAAVFDAVPLQAHPLLAGRLELDDPDDLEARAVGERIHGTAMASLVLHGDLNDPPSPVSRRIYFRPVMYAPEFGDELFADNRLVIDMIVTAVMRMRENGGEQVFIVNLSLGDRTRPFAGKISTWARALDYLSYTYGILFLASAGNIMEPLVIAGFANGAAFHAAPAQQRDEAVLRALDAVKADRRMLAPAESLNALTIGAWNRDAIAVPFGGPSPFAPYVAQDMPSVTSRLGLGHRRSTKPDILMAGGRQPVRFSPIDPPTVLQPHANPSRFWGLKVAAPAVEAGAGTHFTMGTSAANALATHTAHRIFDALERAYPQLIEPMPPGQRAVLIKALLVHCASWRDVEQFIRPIVDPNGDLHHEHWRREVGRHIGYGFVDPENCIACTNDRATLWATGVLPREGAISFDVPMPASLAANAHRREIRATLAWLSPVRPGHLAYRAVKLKIAALDANALEIAGVSTTTGQPSNSQSESGTVVHRRWQDSRIGNLAEGDTIPLQIQREKDQGTPIDEPVSFGLAVTVEMPGVAEIYAQVHEFVAVKPRVGIQA